MPPWLEKLLSSSLTQDTLSSLLPRIPDVWHAGQSSNPNVAASAHTKGPNELIFRGTPENSEQARNLFLHEMGHSLHMQKPRDEDFAHALVGVTIARDPDGKLSDRDFDRESPEWIADAFMTGVSTLNVVMDSDPETGKKAIDLAEKQSPGTASIVRWLLGQPIYKEHPLARVLAENK